MRRLFKIIIGGMIALSMSGEGTMASAPPEVFCPDFLPGCHERVTDTPKEHFFLRDTVPKILNWIMALASAGSVLMGVIAGIMYLFGGANEELLSRAHKTGLFALAGLLLAMFAFFIVEIINRLPFPNSSL